MNIKDYDLEIGRIKKIVEEKNPKSILIQLPDGLKPHATRIADEIQSITSADVYLWAGSCFGACDIPNTKVDLLIQFGHVAFKN